MTAPALKPEEAIKFALMLADGALKPELVIRAIELAGYAIVPAGGVAPGATPPPVPQKPRGPTICPKCQKVRNNGGETQECDRTDCPF